MMVTWIHQKKKKEREKKNWKPFEQRNTRAYAQQIFWIKVKSSNGDTPGH